MRVGIIGGGFGLYGWLPATLSTHVEVATLERYRTQLQLRPELSGIEKSIEFFEDTDQLLSKCECVVIARRPMDQVRFVEQLVGQGWKGCVVLEKPLAPNPEMAMMLLEQLDRANIRVAAGFSLCETRWATAFGGYLSAVEPVRVRINWRFLAHHYRHSLSNWKRQRLEGGGALRFYAIHFIAWLAQAGTWQKVECSPSSEMHDDPVVEFTGTRGSVEVSVLCDTAWKNEPLFTIEASRNGRLLETCVSSDPFAEPTDESGSGQLNGQDKRIIFLRQIIKKVLQDGGSSPGNFLAHVELWGQIERVRAAGTEARLRGQIN